MKHIIKKAPLMLTILVGHCAYSLSVHESQLTVPSAHSKNPTAIRLDPIKPKSICGCFAWQGDKIMGDNTLIYEESGLGNSNSLLITLKLNGKMVGFKLPRQSALAKYHHSDTLKRIFNDTLSSTLYTIQSEWKTTKIIPGPDGNTSHFNVKFSITNNKNIKSYTVYAKGYCGC